MVIKNKKYYIIIFLEIEYSAVIYYAVYLISIIYVHDTLY